MTDDIVTRLRKEFNDCTCSGFNDCTCTVCHRRHQCDLYDILGQASDEIERLRNDVKARDLQILANFKAIDAIHKELYGDG